jgi:hypothetical protein
MPLPTIATPKYPTTIPSSKKKLIFRPFLMKEQKILYTAMETDDQRQIFNAICTIIKNCVEGDIEPEILPMFDLEYIFLKIRSKSVGEIVDVYSSCPKCKARKDIKINLDEVQVQFPENHTNKIMLDEKLGVTLRYPTFEDSLKNVAEMNTQGIVDYICDSIETVFDETMTYSRKDFTPKELKDFVDSLNNQQFEKISDFYKNIPRLNKQVECVCNSCQHEFVVKYSNLSDFFT